ncbi:MAG: hypothetical protein ACI9WU_005493, partial [Myxococcota bacterium]
MRAVLISLVLGLTGCAPAWQQTPHDIPFQRLGGLVEHQAPEPYVVWDWWDVARHSTVVPLGKLVSPARIVDRITGGRPALDTNAFGLVADSPWFTNRIGRRALTTDEVRRGANLDAEPAAGSLVVITGKPRGVTPGVVVRDGKGVVWYVKFDPPAHPELASGAEAVASRVLHAAGWHVPQNFVVNLKLARLKLAPDALLPNKYDAWVPMTRQRLDHLLGSLNPDQKGRARALFSRQVPGQLLGPFDYRGVNSLDPNAIIPAHRRRALRGLWVLMAWLNNSDTRMNNGMDTFIASSKDQGSSSEGPKRGHIRHYLMDFGDSLGSSGRRAKARAEGHEQRVDWSQIGFRLVTLGMFPPYWSPILRSPYRSVGIFEATVFDPARWSPLIPNPAFAEATARDTYWGAALVARFDRPLIEAAVMAGEYSDARASEAIISALVERRQKLLRHAFARVLALDDVRAEGCVVEFTDLEFLSGLRTGPASYHWTLDWARSSRHLRLSRGQAKQPVVDLCGALEGARAAHGSTLEADPFVTLTVHRGGPDLGPPIAAHFRILEGGRLLPIGLERAV